MSYQNPPVLLDSADYDVFHKYILAEKKKYVKKSLSNIERTLMNNGGCNTLKYVVLDNLRIQTAVFLVRIIIPDYSDVRINDTCFQIGFFIYFIRRIRTGYGRVSI